MNSTKALNCIQYQKWPAIDTTKSSPSLSDQTPAMISMKTLSLMISAKVSLNNLTVG